MTGHGQESHQEGVAPYHNDRDDHIAALDQSHILEGMADSDVPLQ